MGKVFLRVDPLTISSQIQEDRMTQYIKFDEDDVIKQDEQSTGTD